MADIPFSEVIGHTTAIIKLVKSLIPPSAEEKVEIDSILPQLQEIQRETLSLSGVALSSQQAYSQLLQQNETLMQKAKDLQHEIDEMKDWSSEKEKYELRSPGGICSVYVPKEAAEPHQETHYLCATCYESGAKSILQLTLMPPSLYGKVNTWKCFSCSTEVFIPKSFGRFDRSLELS